jgi:UPF0716 protein FxsA
MSVRYFFFLFLLLPVLEIIVLIQIGDEIGALPTVGWLICSALLGLALMRRQSYSTLLQARQKLEQGQVPALEMVEGLIIAFGGLLLIIPGFITDVMALFCLLPPLRRAIGKVWLKGVVIVGGATSSHYQTRSHDVIEGEFERDSSEKPSHKNLPR